MATSWPAFWQQAAPFVPFALWYAVGPAALTLVPVSMGWTTWSDVAIYTFAAGVFAPLLSLVFALFRLADRARRYFGIGKVWFLLLLALVFLFFDGLHYKLTYSEIVRDVDEAKRWDIVYMRRPDWFEALVTRPAARWLQGVPAWSFLMSSAGAAHAYAWESAFFFSFIVPGYCLLWVYDWASYVYHDWWILFHDLGRGGSAPTLLGWALARIRAYAAGIDVLQRPRVDPMEDPYRGYLNTLPRRQGPRPTILGVTPQRQVDQRAPPNIQAILEEMAQEFVHAPTSPNDDEIYVGVSYLEGIHCRAIRRRLKVPMNPVDQSALDARAAINTVDEYGGELSHFHRDGTSHVVLHPEDVRVVLHPEDVRVVLESGWGERHPFTTPSLWWRIYFNWWLGIRRAVPQGLVITYAPRHQGELDVLRQIVRAFVWYGTEGRIYPLDHSTYSLPPAPAS
ncbi:hypothetical protein F4778DRAFT_779471 [Xylariomycetidae sp. FL2044]|nr:hypothetical protein F4778DRAFT_779471 [Xylariomycetidae sp. FL2044]